MEVDALDQISTDFYKKKKKKLISIPCFFGKSGKDIEVYIYMYNYLVSTQNSFLTNLFKETKTKLESTKFC